jgi:bis(5'-nucleosidyl)-tetraphosphatase
MVWTMNTKRRKRRSAGIVVVRLDDKAPHYLLLRAYRYWDFPKGEVEPGEDPQEAAVREVSEETGLTGLDFRWGDQYLETPPYSGGKVARYYLATSTAPDTVCLRDNPQLGRPEHHEYRWLTMADASALVGDRVREVLGWAEGVVCGPGS